jgi:hypothetical protein
MIGCSIKENHYDDAKKNDNNNKNMKNSAYNNMKLLRLPFAQKYEQFIQATLG